MSFFESDPSGSTQRRTPPKPKSASDSLFAAANEILDGPLGNKIETVFSKIDKASPEAKALVNALFNSLLLSHVNRRSTRKALRKLGFSKDEAKAVTNVVGGLSFIIAANVGIAKEARTKAAQASEAHTAAQKAKKSA